MAIHTPLFHGIPKNSKMYFARVSDSVIEMDQECVEHYHLVRGIQRLESFTVGRYVTT